MRHLLHLERFEGIVYLVVPKAKENRATLQQQRLAMRETAYKPTGTCSQAGSSSSTAAGISSLRARLLTSCHIASSHG